MMSSSVSGSKSSSVLVLFRIRGTFPVSHHYIFLLHWPPHDVASFLLSLASSSRLTFFKELMQSGSSKNLGLYPFSVRLGHGPESEVILLSFFQGVNTPGSFWGTGFPSIVGFFHGLSFSVYFSMSSTKVWLLVLVLTFNIRSTVSSGRSQVKKPFLKSHLEFRDPAMFSKNIEHNIIASCLTVLFWEFNYCC